MSFRLPALVQCDEHVRAMVAGDPCFSGPYVPLKDQLHNRFLLSMDGNGATCSRATAILRSNSVLLKYSSEFLLFYSRGLKPWINFVPIRQHQDAIFVVQNERSKPGTYRDIAEASRAFADRCLCDDALHRYVVLLLKAYAEQVAVMPVA